MGSRAHPPAFRGTPVYDMIRQIDGGWGAKNIRLAILRYGANRHTFGHPWKDQHIAPLIQVRDLSKLDLVEIPRAFDGGIRFSDIEGMARSK